MLKVLLSHKISSDDSRQYSIRTDALARKAWGNGPQETNDSVYSRAPVVSSQARSVSGLSTYVLPLYTWG